MNVFWRLSQAIAWIAGRSDDAVAEAPSAVVYLMLVTEGGGVPEAKTVLWAALQAGTVTATGIGPDGKRSAIPPWQWQDLQPYMHRNTEKLQNHALHPGDGFTEVTVASADVREEWPASPAAPDVAVRRGGGPKPKVDPAAFRAEAIRLIDENGYPDPALDPDWRQADLERLMLQWTGQKISESRVRELVISVLREIKAANSGN
ncbi:MAG: hypothetical protein WCJ41_15275 [Aestuariivirga sp.]|uniref:hypothetical protein n=1 Tax=Aestuariivirga sp. TaxID=2650926 RepID=UPI003016B4A4